METIYIVGLVVLLIVIIIIVRRQMRLKGSGSNSKNIFNRGSGVVGTFNKCCARIGKFFGGGA